MMILVLLLIFSTTTALKLPASRLQDGQRLCKSIHDCSACLMIPDCFATFQPTGFYCLQYPVTMLEVPNGTVIVEKDSCCLTSPQFSASKCGFPTSATDEPDATMPFVLFGCLGAGATLMIAAVVVSVICCRKRKTCRITPSVDMPPASSEDIRMTSASLPRARHSSANMIEAEVLPKRKVPVSCATTMTPPTSIHQDYQNVTSNSKKNSTKKTTQEAAAVHLTHGNQERPCSSKTIKNVVRNPLKTAAQSSGLKPSNLSQLLNHEIQLVAEADWIKRRSTLANHPLDQSVAK